MKHSEFRVLRLEAAAFFQKSTLTEEMQQAAAQSVHMPQLAPRELEQALTAPIAIWSVANPSKSKSGSGGRVQHQTHHRNQRRKTFASSQNSNCSNTSMRQNVLLCLRL
jgi:hypothetical protein